MELTRIIISKIQKKLFLKSCLTTCPDVST